MPGWPRWPGSRSACGRCHRCESVVSTLPLQTLLGAVQRRLWRAHFVAALRRALWASTAVVLLATVGQLAGLTMPVGALLTAVGALWLLLLVRAARQRPGIAACALWADRHLGGASAFTTWLETVGAPSATANKPAVAWLQQWTEQRVPESLRVLNERRAPAQLTRPLLALLVGLALAAVVSRLHQPAPTAAVQTAARPSPAASSVSRQTDSVAALALAPALETAPLVSDISKALRAAAAREAAARVGAGQLPAAGVGKPGDEQASAPAPGATAAAADQARRGSAAAGTPAAAAPTAGVANSSGASAGREAGDSRDQRADVGVSRPLPGPIPMPRSVPREPVSAADKQADLGRLAAYGPDHSTQGRATMRVGPEPAAATPPPASDDTRLTPTQSSYVQAWMKASARNR